MGGKRVPLVIYNNGEREIIGSAYVEDGGVITGRVDDPDVAANFNLTSSIDLGQASISFRGDLALGKVTPDECAQVISIFNTKEKTLDPNSGKLYDSVEEAEKDGVKHSVEISGRKKEIAFVSDSLSKADWKKKKKRQKLKKEARKKNR